MKIWLLGSGGMLGSEVAETFAINGIDTINTNAEIDISNMDLLFDFGKSVKPDLIINCAAYTDVNGAESNEDLAFKVNAIGPRNISMLCNDLGCSLMHISTDYVFDGRSNTPYREDDATNPLSCYGRSKLAGENNIKENVHEYIIIRTSWLYGRTGNNFVKTILNKIENDVDIDVVDDQSGSPTCTKDLAGVIVTMARSLEKKDTGKRYGMYHFSNSGVTTWYGFAMELKRCAERLSSLNFKANIRPIASSEYPSRVERPRYSVLNCDKIVSEYGVDIRRWQDALADFLVEL